MAESEWGALADRSHRTTTFAPGVLVVRRLKRASACNLRGRRHNSLSGNDIECELPRIVGGGLRGGPAWGVHEGAELANGAVGPPPVYLLSAIKQVVFVQFIGEQCLVTSFIDRCLVGLTLPSATTTVPMHFTGWTSQESVSAVVPVQSKHAADWQPEREQPQLRPVVAIPFPPWPSAHSLERQGSPVGTPAALRRAEDRARNHPPIIPRHSLPHTALRACATTPHVSRNRCICTHPPCFHQRRLRPRSFVLGASRRGRVGGRSC